AADVHAHPGAVLRRLAGAVRLGHRTAGTQRPDLDGPEDVVLHHFLHSRARGTGAPPLRPVDELRLAGDAAALTGQPAGHRRGGTVPRGSRLDVYRDWQAN